MAKEVQPGEIVQKRGKDNSGTGWVPSDAEGRPVGGDAVFFRADDTVLVVKRSPDVVLCLRRRQHFLAPFYGSAFQGAWRRVKVEDDEG